MLARSIVSSIISSLLYIGAISVMLVASQIFSAILILVAIVTIIAPICMMKLEFNKPIHVMWSSIALNICDAMSITEIAPTYSNELITLDTMLLASIRFLFIVLFFKKERKEAKERKNLFFVSFV